MEKLQACFTSVQLLIGKSTKCLHFCYHDTEFLTKHKSIRSEDTIYFRNAPAMQNFSSTKINIPVEKNVYFSSKTPPNRKFEIASKNSRQYKEFEIPI